MSTTGWRLQRHFQCKGLLLCLQKKKQSYILPGTPKTNVNMSIGSSTALNMLDIALILRGVEVSSVPFMLNILLALKSKGEFCNVRRTKS